MQDLSIIFVYDYAGLRVDKVVEAAAFVHAKRQRSVLVLVAKGKFHLIAIAVNGGTAENALKPVHRGVLRHSFGEEFPDLRFFNLELLFIGKTEIGAAAAGAECGARRFSLQRRPIQDAEQGAFCFSLSFFINACLDALPGNRVFDNDRAFLGLNNAFIGKLHFSDDSLDQISLFQMCLLNHFM